ncbi:tetratricopeptide repeat protein [soil metagenome]
MIRTTALLSAACTAALVLCGCATEGAAEKAGLRPVLAQSAPIDRPSSTGGLFLAGEVALDAGAGDQAAELFSRASAADPSDFTLKERAFTASLVSGRVERAAELAPAPGEAGDALVALGRLTRAVDALASNHPKDADAILSQGWSAGPHAPAALLLAPWAALASGDAKASLQPHPGSDRVVLSFADLGRARLAERAGRFGVAEPLFKALAGQRDSLFAEAYGDFLERRGRRADAVKLYDAILLKTPDNPTIQSARERAKASRPAPPQPTIKQAAAEALIGPAAALSLRREGDLGLSYMRLSLRLDPDSAPVWVLVGDALNAAGDKEGARIAYEHVRPGVADHVQALTHLAVLRQQADDAPGALVLAKAAFDERPSDPQAMVTYAELMRTAKRYDEAIVVLDKLIVKMGSSPSAAKLYFLRGAAQEKAGRWALAEADLKRSLAIKPDDAEVQNYLGYAWADRGEHLPEALVLLQKAVRSSPQQGALLDSLGWARFRAGDFKAAVIDLERAFALEPSDPAIVDHLGDAYWRLGRSVDARYQWDRVLTLDPEDDLKATARRKLKDGGGAISEATPAPVGPVAVAPSARP